MDEDDEERSFCYIEGNLVDRNTAEEVSELHENVWYRMKPPKKSSTMYKPFVTARQIDLVRTLLMGKHMYKITEVKLDASADTESETPKKSFKGILSLNKKKSSVKFLNNSVYFE